MGFALTALLPAPAVADIYIGAEGAKSLAAALEPRQEPDGSWTFNPALSNLVLKGTCL